MTVHLLHGFNVRDGGDGTVGRWAPLLRSAGHRVVLHNLGAVGLLDLRCKNRALVAELLPLIKPGDTLVCHSNGCLIAWLLVRAGAKPGAVVCVNAALRRDTQWPHWLPVLNLASSEDSVLLWARVWQRMTVRGHRWGSGGRYGFSAGSGDRVCNIDMADSWWEHRVTSHSGAFQGEAARYWSGHVVQWLGLLAPHTSVGVKGT